MDIFDSKGIKPMLISEQVDPYDDTDSIFELKILQKLPKNCKKRERRTGTKGFWFLER